MKRIYHLVVGNGILRVCGRTIVLFIMFYSVEQQVRVTLAVLSEGVEVMQGLVSIAVVSIVVDNLMFTCVVLLLVWLHSREWDEMSCKM